MAQRLPALRREGWVAREDQLRVLARRLEQRPVHLDARDAKARHAGLAGAEHVAFAAQAQVLLGDAEAVLGLAQNLDARLGGFAERRAVKQQAGRALAAAADAAA